MSELDDRLLAQGGACEHLANLFAYKRGMAESEFPCPPLSTTPWTDALTQLLAENERLRGQFTIAFRLHLQSADDDLRELLESEAKRRKP